MGGSRELSLPGDGIVPAARLGRAQRVNLDLVKTTKSYIVTGPHLVGGVAKGGTVSLTLTAGQERDLVEAGHIKLA